MHRRHLFIILCTLIFILFFTSCTPLEDIYPIHNLWYWAPASIDETPADLTDKTLQPVPDVGIVKDLAPDAKGFIWLVCDFPIPPSLQDKVIGVYLNRIYLADETYINGYFMGRNGRFPPNLFSAWNVQRYYTIPPEMINGPKLRVTIKLYIEGEGGIAGMQYIGAHSSLHNIYVRNDFLHSTMNRMSAAITLMISIFFFMIYFIRRTDKEHLYYALTTFFYTFYICNFFMQTIPGFARLEMPYVMFQKIVFSCSFLGFLFYVYFVIEFLKWPTKKPVRWFLTAVCIVPVIVILLPSDYKTYRTVLSLMQLNYFIIIAYSLIIMIRSLVQKKRQAFILVMGITPAAVTIVIDILLRFIPHLEKSMYISHFGVTILLISILYSLALKFSESISQVYELNRELEAKVQDRTRKLEDATEEKTNFFINLAHETKTPLTLIKNYFDAYFTKSKKTSELRIIKQNIDKLLRDMVNFLDAEKLRRNQIFYDNLQPVNLSAILKDKVILFRKIATRKNLNLVDSITEHAHIQADPFAVDRIINNLIDNAIKYTDSGQIDVILQPVPPDQVRLIVRDTGIGMSEEIKANIFRPYHQLSNKKRNIQGLGMGLYITQKIVSQLNAELLVESEEGKGSAFSVTFEQMKVDADSMIDENSPVSIPMDVEPLMTLPEEDIISPNRVTLLIVDDHKDMLFFLFHALIDKYNVITATGGPQALTKLETCPKPDLIISDVMMDDMNGFEFCDAVISRKKFEDIPFIFLTAKTGNEHKLRGLAQGAVDYIYKPFIIATLFAKIDSILRNRNRFKQHAVETLQQSISNILSNNSSAEEITYPPPGPNYEEIYRTYHISDREKEIIELVLEGFFHKEISARLDISIRTVEHHMHNIYTKLGVQSKIGLINFFKK